jgi:protein-tyrosine kinase
MAESIGLIERAAALLRQRDASESGTRPPIADDNPDPGGPQLVLDRGRLASYGITLPSAARSRTVEEFRLIKRNLITQLSQSNSLADQRSNRIIMVTSARPGEGKTFISLNLALAFASERDVKALLVDVDTQHSSIQDILGIPAEQGIVDVLAGNCELSEALIHTSVENLLVLPAGQGGPHVPELFSSNQMATLMSDMTQRFADRYIIIDTPPCMASSDAAALAPLVGQIVFIVEAHHTQQVEIEAALSMLSACPRISLLLNKSDTMSSEHFGYYNYYYYYPQGRRGDVPRQDKLA